PAPASAWHPGDAGQRPALPSTVAWQNVAQQRDCDNAPVIASNAANVIEYVCRVIPAADALPTIATQSTATAP
ncbi:hypothetical protein, partial [Stenotrophomonas sp. PS02301]|uniref:hypothetical protein n=1 Tax=Stenotrophomonas sp. PS02301 TaxID=2991427 RepID=UPI00249AF436